MCSSTSVLVAGFSPASFRAWYRNEEVNNSIDAELDFSRHSCQMVKEIKDISLSVVVSCAVLYHISCDLVK